MTENTHETQDNPRPSGQSGQETRTDAGDPRPESTGIIAWSVPRRTEKSPGKGKRAAAKMTALVLCCALAGGITGAGVMYEIFRSAGSSVQISVNSRTVQQVSLKNVNGTGKMSDAEIYAANVNSVVSINCSGATANYFGQQVPTASSGSGFLITQDGYIITNAHVIDGAASIKVTLYSGISYEAVVVGSDTDYDVAVLKIPAAGLNAATLGDSSGINVGDPALVIGNPLGELTFSMSSGIISCVNRTINVSGTPFQMIQIDTSINAGNSGGPLLNTYGEVIGIVSAKYSGNTTASVEGLGFAIPINHALSIARDLMTNGSVSNKAYIGMIAATITKAYSEQSGLPQGVYVYSVESGSAAEKAGLKSGDVIIRADNTAISSLADLTGVKKAHSAGDTILLEIIRSSQTMNLPLTFGTKSTA